MLFIPLHGSIEVFQSMVSFSLVHIGNRGAAWGVMNDKHVILLIARMVVTLGLILFIIFKNKDHRRIVPFILVIAGALGNIVDCFLYGHVIDMLKFVFWNYHYPVFNVADSSICIGVLWLLILSLLDGRSVKDPPSKEDDREPYRSTL